MARRSVEEKPVKQEPCDFSEVLSLLRQIKTLLIANTPDHLMRKWEKIENDLSNGGNAKD